MGAKRGPNAEWIQGHSRELLVESVEDNLRNLNVDALDVVNLRGSGLMTPATLAELHERAVIGVQSEQGYAEGRPLETNW